MFKDTCKNACIFDKNVYFFQYNDAQNPHLSCNYDAGCDFYLIINLDISYVFIKFILLFYVLF